MRLHLPGTRDRDQSCEEDQPARSILPFLLLVALVSFAVGAFSCAPYVNCAAVSVSEGLSCADCHRWAGMGVLAEPVCSRNALPGRTNTASRRQAVASP